MAPKSAAVDNEALAPRRSGRIAAQPQVVEPATKAPRKASTSKKRVAAEGPAAEEAKAEASAKKSKGDSPPDAAGESAAPGITPIDVGDSLPSLILKNEKGEDLQVADLAKEKGVIFFLVPKADTPGCTNQACGFRDSYPDFSSSNFDVYCLSADSPAAQSKWQTKKELPYSLISDPKRVLITALGAGEGGKTKRSHFIFGKGGKLLHKQIPVKPVESPQQALEFVKNLEKS
ncbi:AhpC-TSA-domain-containing protein [Coprinopsis marcescibilis]|uniref:thioredoxin-dependent peroxiredoxin n=1 Tax=Coprinopsis marcescibilis TaxID=230819 RepID=A0A5C3KGN8_COPMA|nr:AhpC-TSA-domain-containing protein [Coprinopsis marcescibilis]